MSSNNKNKDLVFSAVSSTTDNLTKANALYLYIYQAALLAQKKWPSYKSFKQINRKNAKGQATSVRESWPRDRLTSLCEQISQTPNGFTITKDDIEAVVQAYKYSGVLWGEWKRFSEEKVREKLESLGCTEAEEAPKKSNTSVRLSQTSSLTDEALRDSLNISTPQKDKANQSVKAGRNEADKTQIIDSLKALLNIIAVKNTQDNESSGVSSYRDALNAIIKNENKSSLSKGRNLALESLNAKLDALDTKVENISASKSSDDVNGFVEAIREFNQALSEFCEACRKDSFRHHSRLANTMENYYINELSALNLQGEFIAIEKAETEKKAKIAVEAAKKEREEQRKIAVEKAKMAAEEKAEKERLKTRKRNLTTVVKKSIVKQEVAKKNALAIGFGALKHNMESMKVAEEAQANARLRNSSLSTLNVEEYDATHLSIREQIALEYSLANISAEPITSDDSGGDEGFSDEESHSAKSIIISTTPAGTPQKSSPTSIVLSPALKNARVVRQGLFGSPANKTNLPDHVKTYLSERPVLKNLLLGQEMTEQDSWSPLKITVTSFILYAIEKFTVKKPDLLESVRVLFAINYLLAVLLKLRAPENFMVKDNLSCNKLVGEDFLKAISIENTNGVDRELFYDLIPGSVRGTSGFGLYLNNVAQHAASGFLGSEVFAIQKLRQEIFNMIDQLAEQELDVADKVEEYEGTLFSPTEKVSAVIRAKERSRTRTNSSGSSSGSIVSNTSPDRRSIMCMRPSMIRGSVSSPAHGSNNMRISSELYKSLRDKLGKSKRLVKSENKKGLMSRVTWTYSVNIRNLSCAPKIDFISWEAKAPHVSASLYLLLYLENKQPVSFSDISDVEQGLKIIQLHMLAENSSQKFLGMDTKVRVAVNELCPCFTQEEVGADADTLAVYQLQLSSVIEAVKQYKLSELDKVFNKAGAADSSASSDERGSEFTGNLSTKARLFFEIDDVSGYARLLERFSNMPQLKLLFKSENLVTHEQAKGFFNAIADIVFNTDLNFSKKTQALSAYKAKCQSGILRQAIDDFSTNLKQSYFGPGSSAHNAQKNHPSPDKYTNSKKLYSAMH